jgi:hypothetical protein
MATKQQLTREQIEAALADLDKDDRSEVEELTIETPDGLKIHVRGSYASKILDNLYGSFEGDGKPAQGSKPAQGKQADTRTGKAAGQQQDDEPRRGDEGNGSVWSRRDESA